MGLQAPIENSRTEKYPFGSTGAVQGHERAGKFIGLEGGPAKIASGAKRAVKAVAFANRGQQGFQHADMLPIGQGGMTDHNRIAFARRQLWAAHVFGWFQVHLSGQQFQAIECFHIPIIEQMRYLSIGLTRKSCDTSAPQLFLVENRGLALR